MPPLNRRLPPAPTPDPDEWRPQRFGRGRRPTGDAIIEPSWGGVRVLARFDGTSTRISDEDGVDCTAEFSGVADAITGAARAGELILDGFLTVEPTQLATASLGRRNDAPTAGQMMTQLFVGNRLSRMAPPKPHLDPDRPIAFVAVDLLSIDESHLLDVPLLERKRLLDSALEQGEIVRITPFIRPPLGSFIATWRSAGFGGLAFKAPNSRYLPDSRNDDWLLMPMPPR
jgi:ATP-dependent DNA ligase